MNDLTDQQLLRDYAERRSEPAFAELVRRHVDFVYSAALRMVRDAHLAEDVTQGVFVTLARNAKQLIDHPVLAGWLHRTAQNLAANTVRSDVRRRVREHEAATMNELLSTESNAVWEDIAPHLDAALGELSESDRDVLLLRYFQNKSAREMAQILDTTDDAAQKRVSRAVERLREFFAKRGVAIGAGGLAVVISANAVQAAPAGLAAAISSAAVLAGTTTIAATTTATITKAIAMTTLQKALIAVTIAVTAGAGYYEARQASVLRDQEQTLQDQIQALQQQQAPLNEQIQQLQHERDDVTKQLAAVQEENEQWKSGQKVAGLSQSQSGAGGLSQQSSASSGSPASSSSTGLANMMNDPKMKEYIHQVQLKMIKERYAPLFTELGLAPDNVEKFTQLIGDEWMKGSDMGSSLTQGNADPVATRQAMAKAYTENEDQLQTLLGPAGYARYKEFNQETPARTIVTQLDNQLGDGPLTEDQSAQLFKIVKAEPYTSTHGITGELDEALFGSQEDIDKHFQQVTESNRRILDQAASFLTPQQLSVLATLQNNSLTAQKLQGAALTQKH